MQKITNAIEIIKSLGGDTVTGMCPCPVIGHGQGRGDQKPSLWISPEGDGLKCKVGCTYGKVVDALKIKGVAIRREGNGAAAPRSKSKLPPAPNVNLDVAQHFLDLIDVDAESWTFQVFDRYGASEYVIRQGAVVKVEQMIAYRQYCRPSK